jgi:tripartite-type tricarboxylate transporter receptor subunit TctC
MAPDRPLSEQAHCRKSRGSLQNIGGAGSVIAANQVYRVAAPDGLTLVSILPAIYLDQLVGRKEVQFDYAKFSWIGSTDRSNNLLIMRADTPYKTLRDVRDSTQVPKCAATGTGSIAYYMPKLLEETVGTKFDVVTGYPGGPEMDLAVERNEAQCRAFTLTAFLSNREHYLSWRKTGLFAFWFRRVKAGFAAARGSHPQ